MKQHFHYKAMFHKLKLTLFHFTCRILVINLTLYMFTLLKIFSRWHSKTWSFPPSQMNKQSNASTKFLTNIQFLHSILMLRHKWYVAEIRQSVNFMCRHEQDTGAWRRLEICQLFKDALETFQFELDVLNKFNSKHHCFTIARYFSQFRSKKGFWFLKVQL